MSKEKEVQTCVCTHMFEAIIQNKYSVNNFCVELNINISPVNEGYDITKRILYQKKISLDYINPELVDFLSQHRLKVTYMEILKRRPGDRTIIHTDTFTANGEFVKINWVYGGNNSYMNWYSPKSSDSGKRKFTGVLTEYIEYLPSEVELIATYPTQNKPYIVQAGIPHEIINLEEPRHCICCVLGDISGNKVTMNEVKNLLINYINLD